MNLIAQSGMAWAVVVLFSAALYDLFAKEKSVEIEDIKFQLAAIESFFHGSSSGLDPLVSYLNKKIHMDETSMSTVDWDAPQFPAGFFLVDTKVPRKTEPLVKLYQEKTRETIYKKRIESSLIPLVEEAILMYANQLESKLFETMHELSNFQFRYFDQMIPVEVRSLWLDGLVGNDYKTKTLRGWRRRFYAWLYARYEYCQTEIFRFPNHFHFSLMYFELFQQWVIGLY